MLLQSLRRLCAVLVLPLIIAIGLGFGSAAFAAGEQTSQQIMTATSSDADLWRAVQSGKTGYTNEQGLESGVLINSTAIEDTRIKNRYITPIMGAAIVGVFVAFLLFYFVNGATKLTKGFSGKLVLRWSKADLWSHWILAFSCLGLIVTGLNIMLGKHVLQPYIGQGLWQSLIYISKVTHDWLGLLFVVSWLVCIVKWMPKQTFKMYDFKWFLVVGGYIKFGPFKGKHPDSGFVNAGEKMWFWTLALFGLFIIITGILLVFPGLELTRQNAMLALLIHASSAIIIIGFTIVHIWMATALSEGGMESMKSGYCDENWAVQHHNLWYDEIKANGSIIYKD